VLRTGFGVVKKWAIAKNGSWMFTSNVDGQLQRAGFSPKQIHECHGFIQQFPWS
jgi:NAD-dependent SIR2 family protein deacetylase